MLGRANNRFFELGGDRLRRWGIGGWVEKGGKYFFKNCVRTTHYTTTNTKKSVAHQ